MLMVINIATIVKILRKILDSENQLKNDNGEYMDEDNDSENHYKNNNAKGNTNKNIG